MRMLAVLLILFAAASSGCRRHVVIHEHRDADVVVIERGHVHTDHCGHYCHEGRWYHSAGHIHGQGCGHAHRDGVWVVVR